VLRARAAATPPARDQRKVLLGPIESNVCGRKGGLRGLGAERLKKLVEGVVDLAQSRGLSSCMQRCRAQWWAPQCHHQTTNPAAAPALLRGAAPGLQQPALLVGSGGV
jgi:hypothetical protein